jgi:hypothetical protein
MKRVHQVLGCSLWIGLLGYTPLCSQEAVTFEVGVDHILLRVNNLTTGIETFSRLTGVVPKRGGRHPGRGTEIAS